MHHPPSEEARRALDRLKAGNRRFMDNVRSIESMVTHANRGALVGGQSPFAIVLACSDSRAPAEILFDCGLGDLFIVRVAGNVVSPVVVGSVEFAAVTFGTPLVIVMGHSGCGAVNATLDALSGGTSAMSDNVLDIVERIEASARSAMETGLPRGEQVALAVRANVRASVDHLRHGSRLLEQRVLAGKLWVVGAEYSLESGGVEFFEGP